MIEHSKIVHDTIHVTKVIIDTVRAPSKDSMDLLTRIDTFYNNAWGRLVWVITIVFAAIGVIIPVLTQWYQRRELRLSEERLNNDIEDSIKATQEAFTKYVDGQVEEKFKKLDEQLTIRTANLRAMTFHLQGNIFFNEGRYADALLSFFIALEAYANAGDPDDNIRSVLQNIVEEKPQSLILAKNEFRKECQISKKLFKND